MITKGSICRHKDSPDYWVEVMEILHPSHKDNPTKNKIAKCKWSTENKFTFCLIKHFKVRDLLEIKKGRHLQCTF